MSKTGDKTGVDPKNSQKQPKIGHFSPKNSLFRPFLALFTNIIAHSNTRNEISKLVLHQKKLVLTPFFTNIIAHFPKILQEKSHNKLGK